MSYARMWRRREAVLEQHRDARDRGDDCAAAWLARVVDGLSERIRLSLTAQVAAHAGHPRCREWVRANGLLRLCMRGPGHDGRCE